MTENRFIGSSGGVYDQYKGDRFTWAEWEEIIQIMNNLNEKAKERSKALSKLQKENKLLKKDRFVCLDCEHSGYTEIGCLCEYNDHWQEYINECKDFKKLIE